VARLSSPLLFLGGVALLWVVGRLTVELLGAAPKIVVERGDETFVPRTAQHARAWPDDEGFIPVRPVTMVSLTAAQQTGPSIVVPWQRPSPKAAVSATAALPAIAIPMLRSPMPTGSTEAALRPVMPAVPPALPVPPPSGTGTADRWSFSGWAFVRANSAPASLGQGLLGGSQVGARSAWRIDRSGRAEVHGRIVSSGRLGDGAEAALGVTVQPVRAVPVRLSVERREQIAGSGGRSAFASFVSGGVDDVPMPLRMRLDGYGAAGVVGVRQRDVFAEAAVRLRRPVGRIGPVALDAGLGAWGAVQPGLERIDIGPSITTRWQAGALSPRLSLDWRQRVGGDAAPRSGVAVTLAADF
jgi:hypothetical protein